MSDRQIKYIRYVLAVCEYRLIFCKLNLRISQNELNCVIVLNYLFIKSLILAKYGSLRRPILMVLGRGLESINTFGLVIASIQIKVQYWKQTGANLLLISFFLIKCGNILSLGCQWMNVCIENFFHQHPSYLGDMTWSQR